MEETPFNAENYLAGTDDHKSLALTIRDYAKETQEFLINHGRSIGVLTPGAGLTKVPHDPEDMDDVFNTIQGFKDEQTLNQGGRATDTTNDEPEDGYDERRFLFLKDHEDSRKVAYDDATGLPVTFTPPRGNVTVGVGFNMDAVGARDLFARALPGRKFDDVRQGKASLNEEEQRRLFELTSADAEDIVNRRLKGVILTEHQRLALVSLAFNLPSLIGPNLIMFVSEGRLDEARDEILFHSNKRKSAGLASRRFKEAAMFVGPAEQGGMPDPREYLARFK